MDAAQCSAELIRRARDARDADAFRAAVLDCYRAVVPYDRAVFTEYRRHEPIVSVDVDDASLAQIRFCERNMHRYADELRRCFHAGRVEGGFLDTELFSERERRELPFFREVIEPQKIRATLALIPRWRGALLGMIRLERGRGGSPFRRCDFERSRALLPVVELGLAALDGRPSAAVDVRTTRDGHGEDGGVDAPVRASATDGARSLAVLGPREREVAWQVGRGLTSRQIALLLGTSPLTVRNQISRIFDKVGVASRAELATWIAEQSRAPAHA